MYIQFLTERVPIVLQLAVGFLKGLYGLPKIIRCRSSPFDLDSTSTKWVPVFNYRVWPQSVMKMRKSTGFVRAPKRKAEPVSGEKLIETVKLVGLRCLHLPLTITRNGGWQEEKSFSLSASFSLASSRSPLSRRSFSLYNSYHPKCHASLWVRSSRCASIRTIPLIAVQWVLVRSWVCRPWDLRHFTDERSARAANSGANREANAEERSRSAEQRG